jgi:hypothetical protein
MQNVIVTGSHKFPFERKDFVLRTLDTIHHNKFHIRLLIQGGAKGVDEFAKLWCLNTGVPCAQVDANWSYYGRRAGPVRNYWMANLFHVDKLIAFPGGDGTANMIAQAEKCNIPVLLVKDE